MIYVIIKSVVIILRYNIRSYEKRYNLHYYEKGYNYALL